MTHLPLNILSGVNILEGLVASTIIVLSYYVLRNYFKFSKPMASMTGWFITWTFRKFAVNIYKFLHKYYNFTIQPLQIQLH
jgi:hypothetical protein